MLRIYLDQNKWIDLARASTGHPQGKKFHDVLALARAAVEAGEVSFPLDIYRYWETSKRGDDRSRLGLVEVMLELSRNHTMALPFGLLDQELDEALACRFPVPVRPRRQQVFGVGLRHMAGARITWPRVSDWLGPTSAALPSGVLSLLQMEIDDLVEQELLRAGPDAHARDGYGLAQYNQAEKFVQFEEGVAAAIQEHGLKGDAIDLAVRASDLGDIRSPLDEALSRIGMTFDELHAVLGASGLIAFVDDLPTRHITSVLRSVRHRQTHHVWEPNDFIDIIALPVAAAYCDVVVTERQWIHHLRQGGIPQKYGTILHSSLVELAQTIVAASAQ